MTRNARPNVTLENLDEDIARTMDRLDVLEAYKAHAETEMKRAFDLINDLQERLLAAERELKRPKPGALSRLFGKRQ
jgi:hypothetical protein